jgi:hypothetical protein
MELMRISAITTTDSCYMFTRAGLEFAAGNPTSFCCHKFFRASPLSYSVSSVIKGLVSAA